MQVNIQILQAPASPQAARWVSVFGATRRLAIEGLADPVGQKIDR